MHRKFINSVRRIKSFIILALLRRSEQRVCEAHLRIIASGQHSSFRNKCRSCAELFVGNTVSDLARPRLEPQTSRSRDELVTARPTNWPVLFVKFENQIFHSIFDLEVRPV